MRPRIFPRFLEGAHALAILLIVCSSLSNSYAASYVLNLSTTFGVAPSSASFDYDPVTKMFSGFLVQWNGHSSDLTSAANGLALRSINSCTSGLSGSQFVFDSLTRCRGSVVNVPGWAVYNDPSGIESGPGNHFNAFAFLLPPDDFGSYAFLNDPFAVPYITRIAQRENIGFQVVSTAPEPGTFVLLGTMLTVAGCCFFFMKRPRLTGC